MITIKKIVDLSIPITNDTPIFPGDPGLNIRPATTIEQDGYSVHYLHIGSHTGTHVDAPSHFQENGVTMDESDLRLFIGRGVVIDVTGKNEQEAIAVDDVAPYLERLKPGDIALIYTGWSQYLGEEKYFRHPYLTGEAVDAMLEKGVRTFLIDALNIDLTGGDEYPAHEKITAVNGIIGENFIHFDRIDFPDPLITAFPLKIKGCDGSPVRAVAIQIG